MWFGKDGMGIPRRKTYLSEREGKNVWTWWPNSEVGHSQEATQKVKTLFDGHAYFDYPKPVRLIKKLIQIGSHDDSIVLDFFSGFRVIIMTVANSTINIRVLRLLPKFKSLKLKVGVLFRATI